MTKIVRKHEPFNNLPLWQAARERELRSLPLPARRLAKQYGCSPSEALFYAGQIGWQVDE